MPRVVPSQIVALADRIFSELPDNLERHGVLHPQQVPEIHTILEMPRFARRTYIAKWG
jgi:hypothetical protein